MQHLRTLLTSLRGRGCDISVRGLASLHPTIPQSPVSPHSRKLQNTKAEGKSQDSTITIDPATIEHLGNT